MKKIIFIYVFIFNSAFFTYAQNQISGIITDQDSAPLTGANIYIPELNKGTVSDNNGRYLIQNLPSGKIIIQYSFIGYKNEIRTVILQQPENELNINLKQTAVEAEEIVITGGYHSNQHENAVKIETLKLNQSLLSTPALMEKLVKIPGVEMISKGNGVAKPVIRGLSMDNILALNNGVRNENYQYSDHHPLGISGYGFEDVEIIKGPASLMYGSDAIGGVVNFIKEKPAPAGSICGDYSLDFFSNTLGVNNNIGIKGSSKKVNGGIRFGANNNSDFLQGGGDFVPNSRFNERSLSVISGYTNNSGIYKLHYDYFQQKLGLPEEEAAEAISSRGRKNEIWYQQFNTHFLSSQNKLFLNEYRFEFNGAFQSTGLVHYAGIDETEINMQLSTFTYEAKINFPSNEKTGYILGTQGFSQMNKNINDAAVILLPDAVINSIGFFGLFQYTFFKKLKVQSGIRYDLKSIETEQVGIINEALYRQPLDKFYKSVSGSVGSTYNLTGKLLFRVNFAAAYRTPNLAELTSNGVHELRYESGNNNLNPQNSYETDLSLHYHSDNMTIDLAGFYNIIDHYIYISPTGDTTTEGIGIYKYNQSDALLSGGEAGIHFHPDFMEWAHFQSTFSNVTGKQKNGTYLPFIPANKLTFEVIFIKDKIRSFNDCLLSFNSSTAFKQNNPAPEEEKTDGYSLFNSAIGCTVNIFSQIFILKTGINNIFDTKYIDHLSTLKEVNFYNPGRNITFSLKMPFNIK